MRSPYKITEPTVISFSGGRTSGYMLYRVLQENNGELPFGSVVTFANTGKEMPETLDFVRDCAEHWGVKIHWLERTCQSFDDETKKYGKRFEYGFREVDYASASRDGEPFLELILSRGYAPNPVARFCTADLKVKVIAEFAKSIGFDAPFISFIGIRADELARISKNRNQEDSSQIKVLPLADDGITKYDVKEFWDKQNFDLNLPNVNGVTDWGNCDLCFLKGARKRLSIIRDRPDLADWWIKAEKMLSDQIGKKATFTKDSPNYSDLKIIATSNHSLFDFDDTSIPCFCGE